MSMVLFNMSRLSVVAFTCAECEHFSKRLKTDSMVHGFMQLSKVLLTKTFAPMVSVNRGFKL